LRKGKVGRYDGANNIGFLLWAGDEVEDWELQDYEHIDKSIFTFWQGCKKGVTGVSVLMHLMWIEIVV